MTSFHSPGALAFALRPLAASLTLVLAAAAATDGRSQEARPLLDSVPAQQHRSASHFAGAGPAATTGTTRVVQNCNDIGPGSLRDAYLNVQDGDTIDLTQLQCSVITTAIPLTDGAAENVTLQGPGRDRLTISGTGAYRVLVHNGDGNLTINDLTIANGKLNNPYNYGGGGCIYSQRNVQLYNTDVKSCGVATASKYTDARGGAIFARYQVGLNHSTVTGSTAYAHSGQAYGAGIFADSVIITDSTVSGNTASAHDKGIYGSHGGGIFATTEIITEYSTVSGNRAGVGAGLFLFGNGNSETGLIVVRDSTISGNQADAATGGIFVRPVGANSTYFQNSTIAFNSAATSTTGAGVWVSASAELDSTIIAKNTAGNGSIESDLAGYGGVGIAGSSNLIMQSSLAVPADTLNADPLLGPLQDNGGPTETHALSAISPALNKGNNAGEFQFDQRGTLRSQGPGVDIGAFEFDRIFGNGFDPP